MNLNFTLVAQAPDLRDLHLVYGEVHLAAPRPRHRGPSEAHRRRSRRRRTRQAGARAGGGAYRRVAESGAGARRRRSSRRPRSARVRSSKKPRPRRASKARARSPAPKPRSSRKSRGLARRCARRSSSLAVAGAEQILRREVDAKVPRGSPRVGREPALAMAELAHRRAPLRRSGVQARRRKTPFSRNGRRCSGLLEAIVQGRAVREIYRRPDRPRKAVSKASFSAARSANGSMAIGPQPGPDARSESPARPRAADARSVPEAQARAGRGTQAKVISALPITDDSSAG